MTTTKKYFVFLSFLVLLAPFCNAQDVEFSQFYTSRVYLNPAFTGLKGCNSFTTVYRNQWPAIQNAYDSYYTAYERKMKKHDAGISVYFLSDLAGEGSLRRQNLSFTYAKQIRFSKNWYGAFGIRAGYTLNSINWSNLTWGDMIDARKGFVYSTNQPRGADNEHYFDAGAGAIFYNKNMYGGFAVDHLNRPENGMLSIYQTSRLPMRLKVHYGGNIAVDYAPNTPQFNIAPQIIYTKQLKSQQFTLGSYFIYNKFVAGVWYRVKDSFILLTGVETNKFRIGYSFDLGANSLVSQSGGAHEISISYLIDCHSRNKPKKFRMISCPVF